MVANEAGPDSFKYMVAYKLAFLYEVENLIIFIKPVWLQ